MPFEEDLATRLKALPTKPLSDDVIARVKNAQVRQTTKEIRRTFKNHLVIVVAAVVPIMILGAVLYNVHVLPIHSQATRQSFSMLENPRSVTPTPLDTAKFRSTLRNYLERHSLSDSNSSSTVQSLSSAPVRQYLPVVNQVSDVAIRWSQVKNDKYGAALVSFFGNGKARLANVLVMKSGTSIWTIKQIDILPSAVSKKTLNKFKIYPMDWGGTGFDLYGQVHMQYRFMSGLIINASITRVETMLSDGTKINLPINNGVYGYFTIAPSGAEFYNGAYQLYAYNKWGHLIFKLP